MIRILAIIIVALTLAGASLPRIDPLAGIAWQLQPRVIMVHPLWR